MTWRLLIEEIKLIPQDGQPMIELIGALAGILALGQSKRPQNGLWGHSTTRVRGQDLALTELRAD